VYSLFSSPLSFVSVSYLQHTYLIHSNNLARSHVYRTGGPTDTSLRRVSCFVAALLVQIPVLCAWPQALVEPCRFSSAEVAWIQRALDGWEMVSRDDLHMDPTPLPWIVLFDAACAWHLAPEPTPYITSSPIQTSLAFGKRAVPVRALAHQGTIVLPNGVPMGVEMKASTSLYRNGRAAFFAMAMPSVWQTRDVSAPTRAEYLQGVFSHEMTHIKLLVGINRRVDDLVRRHDLAYPVNDDQIQQEFHAADGFQSAFKRERDHFFKAALEQHPAKRLELTRRALAMVRRRHARYFTGPNEAYAEIESLFLTMEGVGQWAAYRLSKARAGGHDIEALRLVRDNRRFWSQEEGLALFMLIDALVPDWQSRIFNGPPASPFALLEEAASR
jgi:hypothetical protein